MLKSTFLAGLLATAPLAVTAQVTLTAETTSVGSSPHYIDTMLADVLDRAGVATLQITEGATLTNSVLAVAKGELDIAAAPLKLPFFLSKGIGPYSSIGAETGAELAGNIQVVFFSAPSHQVFSYFDSNPVADIGELNGKRIWNGPPRGAALTSGRALIQLLSGLKDGEGYDGIQTPWPESISTITSGASDAWTAPVSLPSTRVIRIATAGAITVHDIPSNLLASRLGQQIVAAPGHAPYSIPVDTYRDIYGGKDVTVVTDDETFDSFSIAFGQIVSASMDEDLVYKIASAVIAGQAHFEAGSPIGPYLNMTFGDIDGVSQGACGAVEIKMHPGAIRAYEDAGFTVADCLRP